jgi:hypothetical protein
MEEVVALGTAREATTALARLANQATSAIGPLMEGTLKGDRARTAAMARMGAMSTAATLGTLRTREGAAGVVDEFG